MQVVVGPWEDRTVVDGRADPGGAGCLELDIEAR